MTLRAITLAIIVISIASCGDQMTGDNTDGNGNGNCSEPAGCDHPVSTWSITQGIAGTLSAELTDTCFPGGGCRYGGSSLGDTTWIFKGETVMGTATTGDGFLYEIELPIGSYCVCGGDSQTPSYDDCVTANVTTGHVTWRSHSAGGAYAYSGWNDGGACNPTNIDVDAG